VIVFQVSEVDGEEAERMRLKKLISIHWGFWSCYLIFKAKQPVITAKVHCRGSLKGKKAESCKGVCRDNRK